MKSLPILLLLLTAGILPLAQGQVRPQQKNETGRNNIEFLFPDLQRDLANLQAKEVKPQPDRSIISSPIENRLFTNYKPPVAGNKAHARLAKSTAQPSPTASDISVKEATDKLKAAQAAQAVKPVIIPSQGSEANNVPVKKKS